MKLQPPQTASRRRNPTEDREAVEAEPIELVELVDELLSRVIGGAAPDVTTECNDVNCD